MAKIQYDKKQMPAVLGMAVVSVGLFGFFVWKMTTPPPLQAAPKSDAPTATASAATTGARPTPATPAAGVSAASSAATVSGLSIQSATLDLKNPFIPAISDGSNTPIKPVRMASAKTSETDDLPTVPGLPPVGSVHPLTASLVGSSGAGLAGSGSSNGSAAPSWTVTGVISEASDPHNRVAILRAGDVRRFVRLGDMVDSDLRLVGVSRSGVTLASGSHTFHLMLGGGAKKGASAKSVAVPKSELLPTGMLAPDFTVQDRSGNSVKLSDLRGKVVVIDFWATWCGPCQKSLPLTNSVAEQFAGKNVVVLAVNVWDTSDAFQAWLPLHAQLNALDFAIDTSPKGQLVTQLYQVSGIPTQYVIDKSGKIVTSLVGASDSDDQLVAAIQQALSA